MKIDDLQREVARKFFLDPQILAAVERAEGNIVKAVQCSLPSITTRKAALEVTARSCVHALWDWIASKSRLSFIEFWGKRWAPVGVANDPHNLNTNWARNVETFWQDRG
jgi:hypothetical protein